MITISNFSNVNKEKVISTIEMIQALSIAADSLSDFAGDNEKQDKFLKVFYCLTDEINNFWDSVSNHDTI